MEAVEDTDGADKPRKARALFDNSSECADELAFRRGDILTVLTPSRPLPPGWWLCSLRGRQGLCPANRLRIVSESTRDRPEPKAPLRRVKSMHHSTGPDDSPSAYHRSQLRRSASSLSGVRPASLQEQRTSSPGTYDTPPSPRAALRPLPALEYDVPRSERPCRSAAPTPPPRPLPVAVSPCPRPADRGQDMTVSGTAKDLTPRNSVILQNGSEPVETRVSESKVNGDERLPSEINSMLDISFEEQEMQMNAVLAELLDCVQTGKQRTSPRPDRWQSNHPAVSSTRPRSDNVDSCESSPTTSPCSSQRLSDSTSSSWTMAPPVGPTAATSFGSTVAPSVRQMAALPVFDRTLLRLQRELSRALQRLQEPCCCPSAAAAILSFRLNVYRLRSALQDLLQLVDFAAGTPLLTAQLQQMLPRLREAGHRLEKAAARQETNSWSLSGEEDGGDNGMEDLQAAARTLADLLPMLERPAEEKIAPQAGTIRLLGARAVSSFRRTQSGAHRRRLREALGRLMRAAHDRQPAAVLPALCKFVVLSAYRLVILGDEAGGGAEDSRAGWRLLSAADELFVALRRTLSATKEAAVAGQSDSCDAVREMADATQVLAEAAAALDRQMTQQCVVRDDQTVTGRCEMTSHF